MPEFKTRPVIREVYGSAGVPSEEAEEHFFTRIRLPSGVFKTTAAHRLDDLNEVVAGLLPDERPLDLMDVGVSSGVTTGDWSEQLDAAGVAHTMFAGDSQTEGVWFSFGWADVLLDRNHRELLYADMFGRAVDVSRGSLKSRLVVRALKIFVRSAWLIRPRIRHVQLVSRRLRERPAITIVEDDILISRPDFNGRLHALRAANILNRGYFDDDRLRAAVGNLRSRLRPDGLLIICRTIPDGTNHGTVFRLGDGRWAVVARVGNGSEIEDLVLGTDVPRTGVEVST